jgi:hypothetical protein
MNMSDIITNNGLNLPVNMTEDQFFDAGKWLAKAEQGMQWAKGDWYNAIPWGDKQAACEKAGLNYKTTRECGTVAEIFQIGDRSPFLGYTHHMRLAIADLTDDQRIDLLRQAEEQKWSVSKLTAHRDALLGRKKENPTLTGLEGKKEKLIEQLPVNTPKTVKAKVEKTLTSMQHEVEKATAKQYEKMKHDFDAEVAKKASDLAKEQRDKIHRINREVEEEKERLKNLRQNLDGLMTQDEYRIVLACLHPDTGATRTPEQRAKAFTIFSRLEKSVNREMPAELRRARGWR